MDVLPNINIKTRTSVSVARVNASQLHELIQISTRVRDNHGDKPLTNRMISFDSVRNLQVITHFSVCDIA